MLKPLMSILTSGSRSLPRAPVLHLGPFLIALMLAFPSPGPAFDSVDDEAVLEVLRSSRSDRRPEGSKRRRPSDPEKAFAGELTVRCFDALNQFMPADEWTPRLFSRPPPSA
jgi:hypothetical protein